MINNTNIFASVDSWAVPFFCFLLLHKNVFQDSCGRFGCLAFSVLVEHCWVSYLRVLQPSLRNSEISASIDSPNSHQKKRLPKDSDEDSQAKQLQAATKAFGQSMQKGKLKK